MLAASLRHGYADASVSRTIVHAGVSRPTFYDYFKDKDDCFLALQHESAQRLVEHVHNALAEAEPTGAIQSATCAIVAFAEEDPDTACFLMDTTTAGGPRALEQRERAIVEITRAIEQARAHVPVDAQPPTYQSRRSSAGCIGCSRRCCAAASATSMASPKTSPSGSRATCNPARRTAGAHSSPDPRRHLRPTLRTSRTTPPPPLRPGRQRLSNAEVARNQRERILHATAIVAAQKGYNATTVADITAAAMLDRRVFYSHFPDKQQALLTLHEFVFRHAMAIAAGAYFSASTWPERLWESIRALSHFDASYPVLTRIGFIESSAVGALAAQGIDANRAAFAIFLQEGYQHAARPPRRTTSQAIAATIFDIGHRQAREEDSQFMPHLAGHAVYIALTPFLGARRRTSSVDSKLREGPCSAARATAAGSSRS